MVCRCGSKTTTCHDKPEVVVDLYMYIRRRAIVNLRSLPIIHTPMPHSKPEVTVDHICDDAPTRRIFREHYNDDL